MAGKRKVASPDGKGGWCVRDGPGGPAFAFFKTKAEAVAERDWQNSQPQKSKGAIDPPCPGCGLPEPNRVGHMCLNAQNAPEAKTE